MKKLWASSVLFIIGASLVSGCTITEKSDQLPIQPPPLVAPSNSVAPAVAGYPSPTSAVDTSLEITLLSGNAMMVTTRHLSCTGSTAVSGTDFPDGDSACAAVTSLGKLLQTEPKPNDEKVCTGVPDQNVADVFGIADGKHIRVSFMRNNVCNVQTWDKITALIGTGAL